jgi:hypothetical protein
MNCCDEYGDCRQGRDCPARVAKVGQRIPKHPKPLRAKHCRNHLKDLARAMLLVVGVMLISALTVGVIR